MKNKRVLFDIILRPLPSYDRYIFVVDLFFNYFLNKKFLMWNCLKKSFNMVGRHNFYKTDFL